MSSVSLRSYGYAVKKPDVTRREVCLVPAIEAVGVNKVMGRLQHLITVVNKNTRDVMVSDVLWITGKYVRPSSEVDDLVDMLKTLELVSRTLRGAHPP
jgi:hypothetical protein